MPNKWFQPWDKCLNDLGGNNVATLDCVKIIFLNILGALLGFAELIALIMLIVGGFKYMNSEGDPKKVEGAKNNFTYGVLGIFIVLFSFLIIRIIAKFTGAECIRTFGFGC